MSGQTRGTGEANIKRVGHILQTAAFLAEPCSYERTLSLESELPVPGRTVSFGSWWQCLLWSEPQRDSQRGQRYAWRKERYIFVAHECLSDLPRVSNVAVVMNEFANSGMEIEAFLEYTVAARDSSSTLGDARRIIAQRFMSPHCTTADDDLQRSMWDIAAAQQVPPYRRSDAEIFDTDGGRTAIPASVFAKIDLEILAAELAQKLSYLTRVGLLHEQQQIWTVYTSHVRRTELRENI